MSYKQKKDNVLRYVKKDPRIVSSGDENAKDDVRVEKDQRNNNEMKITKTCIMNMITYM